LGLQGYLAHKKFQPPRHRPIDPRHRPTVRSWEEAVPCERGTPVPLPNPRSPTVLKLYTLHIRSLYLDPFPPAEHLRAKDRIGVEFERVPRDRCRAISAQIRQSRPDSGLDLSHFQAKLLNSLKLFPWALYLDPVPPAEHLRAQNRLGVEFERVLRELWEHAYHEHQRGGPDRCRANSTHIRRSRPDSGLDVSHFSGSSLSNGSLHALQ